MLYLSRFVDSTHYGIADTDDDSEEVVRIVKLAEAASYNIKVEGIDARRVNAIEVYQPVDTLSLFQLKTKVVLGVDIKIYHGIISSVRWDKGNITSPVTIRLSDYGKSCACFILTGNKQEDGHKVTIVLDDSLEFSKETFNLHPLPDFHAYAGVTGFGAKYDVHELSDKNAKKVYMGLFVGGDVDLERSIIDEEKRKKKFIAERYWR